MSAQPKPSSYLFPLRSDEIDAFWPKIGHLVEKPLTTPPEDRNYSIDDIRDALRSKDMQCWVAHDGQKILAVAITEVVCFPRRKVLYIPFVGAETGSIDLWLGHMEAMKAFAREMGCEAVRGGFREGWVRKLKPDTKRVEFEIQL